MSLSDLASLGSFVSGLAVLASLVFLYFQVGRMNEQIRQTEKNQQAAISLARSNCTVDIVARGIEPSFAEPFLKVMSGSEDVSATALAQFRAYSRAAFFNYQDAFYQHMEGLLTDVAFSVVASLVRSNMSSISYRAQWRMHRPAYGTEFAAWMDKLVAQTPMEPFDIVANWKDALAAEKSGAP